MITLLIIAITVFISITSMENHTLKNKLMFNAYMIHNRKEWWRFFSSGLIHADWMHLGFNMFSFYMFGRQVETAYGYIFGTQGFLFFLLLYIGGLVMSSLYSYEKNKQNIYYNALGASGAVSAVVFAYIIIAPTAGLYFFFIPVPIPAYLFGLIFLGVEYYLGKRGNSNIGHDAHFWGAVYGALLTIVLKPSLFMDFIDQILGRV
ncbi:MAG: rhomboid family intramembrane serine protease [Bacteroidia bacterium]|nr:rhomboid family intramembrane serine protease [Bacteroidia bacterium]